MNAFHQQTPEQRYDEAQELLRTHGFRAFTELQKNAFTSPETYDPDRDLFVIGETSSGKTLIPLLLYEMAVREARSEGREPPRMLFVVPYRALAAQKEREIRAFLGDEDLIIVQSTGEYRQDDPAVQQGQVHVAIIITEKVYKYESRDSGFLSQYDFLVLDEVGLLDNADRGVRLDFIFAWAHNQQRLTGKPRTIALGTPFYDWSAYIDCYHFFRIQADRRPIRLEKQAIIFDQYTYACADEKGRILRNTRLISEKNIQDLTEKFGSAMSSCKAADTLCPLDEPIRRQPEAICPLTDKPCGFPVELLPAQYTKKRYILLKICREHLLRDRQILIFINDREQAKDLCLFLFRELKEYLPEVRPAQVCKEAILADSRLEAEDVFGVLEDDRRMEELELYQAFDSGISFHNRSLPNELRAYVEDALLESRKMKIVCSTETLAYGVNSSVDVVIIMDLHKNEGGEIRRLTLNEFQNYAGRAGRLRPGQNTDEALGYVYAMVPALKKPAFDKMMQEDAGSQSIFSRVHQDDGQRMPFFLLNLLPTDASDAVSPEQLVDVLSAIPQDGSYTQLSVVGKVQDSLDFLMDQGLAFERRPTARERRAGNAAVRYCLTERGSALRGYILSGDDYLCVVDALKQYADSVFRESDQVTFLYRLLQTRHAASGLTNIFSNSVTRWPMEALRDFVRSRAGESGETLDWLEGCTNERILSVLAAMLAWCGGASAKTIYRQFGMHYALLAKLAEQIAYLIEIAAGLLPFRVAEKWEEMMERSRRFGGSHAYMDELSGSFQDRLEQKNAEIQDLFISVYYGINTDITAQLLTFLEAGGPAAQDVARELSLAHVSPESARTLRRIAVRYLFFMEEMPASWPDIETRNNYFNQCDQYRSDIRNMKAPVRDFFAQRFGEGLNRAVRR